MALIITDEMAADMRRGAILEGSFGQHGLRKPHRMWLQPATGCFIADCGGIYLVAETQGSNWTALAIVRKGAPDGNA